MPAIAYDPACGAGHMAMPLGEYFTGGVHATDVHDWGFGVRRDLDFTLVDPVAMPLGIDWIVTNPPFTLAERFLDKALGIARAGVAMLLRLQWLEGEERYELIYRNRKPLIMAPFAERVPMIEGVWDPEATTATAYAWFIWAKAQTPRTIRTEHIEPGAEKRHTRTEDMALATPGEAARRRRARMASATENRQGALAL